jgi:hypothetical protein
MHVNVTESNFTATVASLKFLSKFPEVGSRRREMALRENSAYIHAMVYSLGVALALIVGIRIVIKLFAYIVKTLVVMAVIGVVCALAKLLADLLGL